MIRTARIWTLATLAALTLAPALVAGEEPPNLLANGAMTAGQAAPEGWSRGWVGSGTLEVARDTTVFKSAPASLCVRSVGGPATGGAQHALEVSWSPFVLSGQIRCEGVKSASVAVQAFDAAGKQIAWLPISNATAGAGWQSFSSKVALPREAAGAMLLLAMEGDGKAWLDDVKLERAAERLMIDHEAPPLPVMVAASDRSLRWVGRFDTRDGAGPRCDWSASAVQLRFRSSALNVRLKEDGHSEYEVVVDGRDRGALKPQAGEHLYRVYEAPAAGDHRLELVRRTEPFVGTTQFLGFQLAADGKLLPAPAAPAHRIEVIGDSISCGYGDEAGSKDEHFSAETENAYQTYGAIAARRFGADYQCVAWSGRLMWPTNTTPELYGQALGKEAAAKWDPARSAPDVVVIALGTNDFARGAPDQKGWTGAYKSFIRTVLRKNYPRAAIYCATSPMQFGETWEKLRSYVEQIVQDLNAEGDKNVRVLLLKTQDTSKGLGADWHPNVANQTIMADTLTSALRSNLAWKPVGQTEAHKE